MYDTGISPAPSSAYDVDANNIYWGFGSDLKQRPRTGGATTVLATNQLGVQSVDAYKTDIFWAINGEINTGINGGIFSKPIGGGSTTTYSTTGGKDFLLTTDTDIFYTNPIKSTIHYLRRSDNLTGLLLGVYLPDGSTYSTYYSTPFVTDGIYVYATYTSYPTGQIPIVRVPIHGGQISIFASYTTPGYYYRGLSIDNTNLYYLLFVPMEPSTSGIWKQPFIGGSATKLVGSGGGFSGTIATDGTNVYYADANAKQIRKVSVNGGTTSLITTLTNPGGSINIENMKVSNQCVYWYNNSTTTIQTVAVSP